MPGVTAHNRCGLRAACQDSWDRSWLGSDLKGSLRAAAELAGCSHHTVERYVGLRDAGQLPTGLEPVERAKLIDPFLDK